LDFIEQQAECILSAEPAALADLITRNVAIKARVVSSDERESGRRAHLNFGHTIGHAVETAGGYQSVSHGQAVALGMVAACRIALARGLISPDLARRLTAALSRLHLPTGFGDLPGLPPSARDPARLQEIMAHDQKARGGAARFVLPTGLGSVAIYDDVSGQEIAAALAGL
jgi:3-dehydroquinate synthetase